ncbi:MAG: hypothetical protein ACJAUP_001250 [Cellvibrionaceae bacterium]|jgi:hypothetical protein
MPWFLFILLSLSQTVATSSTVTIPTISVKYPPETMMQWKSKSFMGNTLYEISFDDKINQPVIRAESNGTASGLFFEERIDLNRTPWLSWSWKVEKFPNSIDEKTKAGDDYAARIYVVIKDGWTILGTKAINYVWSQQSPAETSWPNPFAGKKAMMFSVQQGNASNGWVMEKRNLKEDLKKVFGKDFQYIDGIAIMTDTDNSFSSAISYYSALTLSSH